MYFDSPVEAALHWVDKGAAWLHLVDLDAALGRGDNRDAIRAIVDAVDVRVELGGGIRSVETARAWLELVDRVILGTVVLSQPEVVDALLADYGPERIAVSIDAKQGQVAVRGWREVTDVAARELAKRVAGQGVEHMIYTDIDRDGTMKGINPEPVSLMRSAFEHTLVAGGGVGSDKDLELYESLGLDGAIVGRALYEGTITYPRPA